EIGRYVIHVCYRGGWSACNTLRRAVPIRVACDHADRRADIGIAQLIGRCRGSADVAEARTGIALPVIADRSEPIQVRKRIRGRERLVFGALPTIAPLPI